MLDFTQSPSGNEKYPYRSEQWRSMRGGTTGLSESDPKEADNLARANKTPIFVASNFAISAVLMMRFAAEAVKYMPNFEIVETHDSHKLDAPSGTTMTTAKMMCANREVFSQESPNSFELLPGCRGGDYQGHVFIASEFLVLFLCKTASLAHQANC